ncbi:MAG: hypothetical protein ACE5Q3_12140 [Alphaproteobacteria bacterium]
MRTLTTPARKRWRALVFEGFVLAGAIVNLAVVLVLLLHWATH